MFKPYSNGTMKCIPCLNASCARNEAGQEFSEQMIIQKATSDTSSRVSTYNDTV
jgi:hypothetical protein